MDGIYDVAPFAGAWIEISSARRLRACRRVAPFAGAWIEMRKDARTGVAGRSLPSRERGLKCPYRKKFFPTPAVAPFAGAWIEINVLNVIDDTDARRSLRGSVD